MRLGDFNLPLFSRDHERNVPRYLLHQSRTLLKSLREIRTSVNANEDTANDDRARSLVVEPVQGRQITNLPNSEGTGPTVVCDSPGLRIQRIVDWVSVHHGGPTSTTYQLFVYDGTNLCALGAQAVLGSSGTARFDGPFVLEQGDDLQINLKTAHSGTDYTWIVAHYADTRYSEKTVTGTAKNSGVKVIDTAATAFEIVAAPGQRLRRIVPYVMFYNSDTVAHAVWLTLPDYDSSLILSPGIQSPASLAVARFNGPFVLTDATTDGLNLTNLTGVTTASSRAYAPFWEERIPEVRT